MVYKKKTAREKLLDSKDLPKIEEILPKQEKLWGKGTIVIPAPIEVAGIMRSVPMGRLITINRIRQKLAEKHKATIGCPITTGIFASIAAQAAEEERTEGQTEVTPWWRTLKEKGALNPKYPGGEENQKQLLEKEGFEIIKRGQKFVVSDYNRYLI